MNLLLARHGQTRWNAEEIFRGRTDIELDETGLGQSEHLAGYLRDTRIDRVISSPLKRALATAGTAARYHGIEVGVSPSLLDMDYGIWQGLTREEVSARYPALWSEWVTSPQTFTAPGGEGLKDVRSRALKLVRELAGQEGTALLVSHRVVLKILILALLGLEDSRFWNVRMDTCGLTTFIRESGRYVLSEHNNTSFLKVRQPCPDF